MRPQFLLRVAFIAGLLFSSCSVVEPTLVSPSIEVHIAPGQFARGTPISIHLSFPERNKNFGFFETVVASIEPQIVAFDDAQLETGEPFHIAIQGLTADRCNQAWGNYSGSFDAQPTIVASGDIIIMQTLLGCTTTTVELIVATSTPKPLPEYQIFLELASEGLDPGRPILIEIWNAEQLAIREGQAGCTVTMQFSTIEGDESEPVETVNCPEGVIYQALNPEVREFWVADMVGGGLTVTSSSVRIGEKMAISVRASSDDGCNSIHGNTEFKLNSTTKRLNADDLMLHQTLMACIIVTEPPNP